MIANAVNNATIFIANIIIARKYGQESFGLFSLAVNIALLTLTISEFGMNYSMIRLYKKHIDDPAKSRAVLLANMYFKVLVLLFLVGFGCIAGRFIADTFMHDAGRWMLAGVALVSGGIIGLWSFTRAYFQVVGRFRAIAVQTIIYALLRMMILGGLFLWPGLASEEFLLLAVYIFPLSLILWWGIYHVKNSVGLFRIGVNELLVTSAECINYSWWVAVTGISFVLMQQSMVFIVSIVGGIKQVALLSAGLVFTAVFSMINDAICQVLYAKVAGLSPDRIGEYKRRLLRLAPFFLAGSLVIISVLSIVMVLFLGEKYTKSLPIFWVTGFGAALTAFISYYSMVMHTIQRPQIGAYVNLAMLVCFCLSGVLLMKYVSLLAVVAAYVIFLATGELLKSMLVNRAIARQA
jgi:O-antigen/teichoic acid export membrane protein